MCVIMHNMMVEVRLGRDQEENGDYYQVQEDSHRNRRDDVEDQETAAVEGTVWHYYLLHKYCMY